MRATYAVCSNTNKKILHFAQNVTTNFCELQYVGTLQKAKNFSTNTVSYYLNYVDTILGWFATQSSQEKKKKLL